MFESMMRRFEEETVRYLYLMQVLDAGEAERLRQQQEMNQGDIRFTGANKDGSAVDTGAPVIEAFPGGAVDQIEADVVEAGGARIVHCFRDPPGRVPALERGQHMRPGALHAERDAVDALLAQLR